MSVPVDAKELHEFRVAIKLVQNSSWTLLF